MTAIRKREWTTVSGEKKTAWLVDYRDSQGKRRAKQFTRKKDASAWSINAEYQVSQGTHTPDSQSITVSQAADNWLSHAESEGLERSTLHGYDNLARLHVTPLLGSIKLSKLTRPRVEQVRDDLLKTRSHAMTKKAVQALSSIINEAMRRGLVAQNVAKGVNTGKKKGRTARVVIPERSELRAMIKVCQDGELALILTFIFTGIRASEFRGLPWRDVDLSANELRVSQRADQWCQIGPPKSDAGYRTIPLPDVVVTALRRWKLACPPSTLDLVFPSGAGTPFGYQNLLRRVFFPIQIRAGITRPVTGKGGKPKRDADGNPMVNGKYGFHALRHAAASGWIDQNIDLKRLQTWMGHESIQITLDTYGHLISDKAKDAAIASEAERALFS